MFVVWQRGKLSEACFLFCSEQSVQVAEKQSQWEDGRVSAAPWYIRTTLALSLSDDKLMVRFLCLIEPAF